VQPWLPFSLVHRPFIGVGHGVASDPIVFGIIHFFQNKCKLTYLAVLYWYTIFTPGIAMSHMRSYRDNNSL
jgi:hypothetical protein